MKDASVVLSCDELMLAGELYMPDGPGGSFPALVLCHGIPAVRYNPEEKGGYAELAARFCRAGFITLTFNFRGCGPSQGNIDMLGWADDLEVAIDFLFMVPEVDKKKVCLLGSSGGAATSVYQAARDRRVSAVVAFACPAEFDFMASGHTVDSLIESFREIGIIKDPTFPKSREKWLEGFNTIKPIDYIDRIAPRPLLLVHGDQDEVVPVSHAEALYKKAGDPKELLVLPGAGHRLRQDERAVEAALSWLKKQVE